MEMVARSTFAERVERRFDELLKNFNDHIGKQSEKRKEDSPATIEVTIANVRSYSQHTRSEDSCNWTSCSSGNYAKQPKVTLPSFCWCKNLEQTFSTN